jgi:NAD(P)-dependent dehydrogenase (short-subunit alcohol dehydrogenase family)
MILGKAAYQSEGVVTQAADPQTLFAIRGQTAVITGGTGVLGREMALALGAAGARVAVLARKIADCEEVAGAIRAGGGEALGVAADVTDRASVERAAGEVAARFSAADILINAAGGNAPRATTGAERTFFDLDPSALEDVLRLNLVGTITCCQVFGHGMAERGTGCIVNVASMNALRPLTRIPAYSAAKAAVANFTQWLAVHMAQEYSPHIRVNALAPGFFLTEQNRYLLTDSATGEWTPRGQAIIGHTPASRLGEPQDLIGTLLWLVSPASSFVTGVVVPVDGGFSAYSGI